MAPCLTQDQRVAFRASPGQKFLSSAAGPRTDACLTADPGVASLIPVRSHIFVKIDHEMISTVILLPSADSFKKGCCFFVFRTKYIGLEDKKIITI